ncbi:unnamed protein product, partial [Anisakis simplex]|uniref:Putative xp-G/rad2 DNA repair endonuclease family (inferred by orthology to a S. mansoni protein) n=1 Tax=Anisakis simplex TaxID=6269 RepID=A0A0M3K8I2_ANISI
MGIQGLWPVLEPTAEPVTLESLEGKRFAIDISIWLYQALHGYAAHQQDIKSPHLALIINRLSKLLFYKIKPVFVFDGPNVPQFKRKILREREMKRYMDDMKISKAQKRVLTEMALSNEVDSEHSQDKWINAFSSSSASSSKRKTEEDKLMEKIQLDNAKSQQNTLKLKHEAQSDSDDVQFVYSSQPTCSKSEDVKYDDLDDASMKSLITPDQRLDYLLTLRERERRGRVTEDQVPEDSREFCNFQLKRLLKRNRINEQLDMLKKEALGDMFNSETKSKDGANSQNTVLLSVMEGLTRGHFLTRDVDADVMIDEEQTEKAQQIKESISWPVMLERMRSETNLNGGGVKIEPSESVEIANRNPSPPKDSIKDENTDEDEDEALQE